MEISLIEKIIRFFRGNHLSKNAINEIATKAAKNISLGGFTSPEELYEILVRNVGDHYDLIIRTLNRMVYVYQEAIDSEYRRFMLTPIVTDQIAPNVENITRCFSVVLECYNIANKANEEKEEAQMANRITGIRCTNKKTGEEFTCEYLVDNDIFIFKGYLNMTLANETFHRLYTIVY